MRDSGSSRMSTTASADPFGHLDQPERYSAYRPQYPASVFKRIVDEAEARALTNGCLVDIATGTGKVVAQLARHFSSAYGFDRSKAQLEAAEQGANIKYAEADAYSIPLPDASTNVITIGMGLHWLEVPRCASECRRLLVPGGLLVVLGYPTYTMFPTCPTIDAVFRHWWDSFRQYDEMNIEMLETAFAGVDFTPLTEVARHNEVVVHSMTPDEIVRYVGTWSPVNIWRRLNPDAPDKLEQLKTSLIEAAEQDSLAATDGGLRIPAHFSYFVVFVESK